MSIMCEICCSETPKTESNEWYTKINDTPDHREWWFCSKECYDKLTDYIIDIQKQKVENCFADYLANDGQEYIKILLESVKRDTRREVWEEIEKTLRRHEAKIVYVDKDKEETFIWSYDWKDNVCLCLAILDAFFNLERKNES